jgi:hypothetical protein
LTDRASELALFMQISEKEKAKRFFDLHGHGMLVSL